MAENNEQLYSQFADISALDAQKKSVLDIFLEIKQGIIDLQEAGLKIEKSTGLKSLGEGLKKQKKATDELTLSVEEYNKILTHNAKLEAQIAALQSGEAKTLAELRVQRRLANKELEAEAKITQTLTSSLKNIEARRDALKTRRSNIPIVGEDNLRQIDQLNKRITNLDQIIEKNSSKYEKFKINIGNYAGSLADSFELVRREISRLQREQKDLTIGGDTRGAEAAGRRISELDNIIKVSSDSTKNFNQQVRALQGGFSTLASSGEHSEEFLKEFKFLVAQSVDQARDLKEEIKALSSDTRNLDLMAGSVNFLADSFQVAAGAAQLAGASQEDVARATANLVAIQGVANGLKGIANELTTRGTAANKAYAFVQQQVTILTNASTTATQRWGAAFKLTAFGIIATAIGFIIAQFSSLGKKSEELVDAQESLNNVTKETAESFAKEKVALDILVEEYKRANTTQERRKEIFDELQDKYPSYFGNLDQEKATVEEITEAYNKLSRALLLRARISASTSELAKNEAKAIQLAIKLGKDNLDDIEKFAIDFYKRANSGIVNDVIKGQIADFLSTRSTLKKIIASSQEELDALGGDPGKTGENSPRVKASDKEVKKIVANEKAALAEIISINKSGAELMGEYMESRIADNKEAYDKMLEEATRFKEEELADNQKGFNAGITSIENYNKRKEAIEKNFQLTTLQANISFLEDQVKLLKSYGQDVSALETAIAEAKRKIFEFKAPNSEPGEDEKYTPPGWVTNLTGYLEKAKEEFDMFAGYVSQISDVIAARQKNAIQEQIDEIERKKRAEIDAVTASTDSEEQKAAKIKVIEAKAAAAREALEKKKREADYRAAAVKKALTITEIILTNSLNIVKAVGSAKWPLNIPAILQASAIGLVQLGIAIAQPIPKFAKGKKKSDPYEGPGIVGEAGRELGISRSGHMTLFEGPTLTQLAKGDVILPNRVTEDMLRSINFSILGGSRRRIISQEPDRALELLEKQNEILKRMERKQGAIVHNHIDMSPYYYYHMKQ